MDSIVTHQTVRLSAGAHAAPDEGACVLELASILSGERFSDRPPSVCPALREFLQGYNDGLPDDLRQELFGLTSDIVDTHAPPQVTAWRARLCIDWARSVAGIASISIKFKGSTLSNCARAGRCAAQVGRDNPWCHSQTVAFFTWMARRGMPQALSPVPLPPVSPDCPTPPNCPERPECPEHSECPERSERSERAGAARPPVFA